MAAVSMAMPLTSSLFNPLAVNKVKVKLVSSPIAKSSCLLLISKQRGLVVKSSMKENKALLMNNFLTASAALTASMVVPEVAQAASGVTPSLNNFLLSIGAGGVVLGGILGAIIGVSNFDPVKRG